MTTKVERQTKRRINTLFYKRMKKKIEVGDRSQIANTIKCRLPFLLPAVFPSLRPFGIVTRCL